MTDPDVSGMLRMLTDELQEAEDAGDRGRYRSFIYKSVLKYWNLVWIIGHVLTGWDGSNPLQNPTNLFYQMYVQPDVFLTPSPKASPESIAFHLMSLQTYSLGTLTKIRCL